MKSLLITFLSLFLIVSCKKEAIDTNTFATISGQISNSKSDKITIANQKYSKTITLDKTGQFNDTLQIEDSFYMLRNGEQRTVIELKKGYDINIKYNSNKLVETLSFSGLGAITNNYYANKQRLQESDNFLDLNTLYTLNEDDFSTKVNFISKTLDNLITNAQGLDTTIIENEKKSNQQLLSFLTRTYAEKHEIFSKLPKGKISPTFTYPDINGKNISLNSLKGKYVYIDVWATWCGPCTVQIPYLKKLEESYKDKNIAFVGLSVDTQENKSQWEAMVKQRGLKGYQVLADNDFRSNFVQEYYIKGIPRFILIDPEGKIISPDAPRPSEPSLIELFDELNI